MLVSATFFLIASGASSLLHVVAAADPTPSGTFVSSRVQTYYSSRCSTASGTVSVAPVPTSTTANTNFPGVAVSSTNTFTPLTYTSTTTDLSYPVSSTTVTVFSVPTAAPARRELGEEDNFLLVDRSGDDVGANVAGVIQSSQRQTLEERGNSVGANVAGTDLDSSAAASRKRGIGRRASYPTQVNCAVTTMVMTTSFFTATAATRTAGVYTVRPVATSVVPVGNGFVLKLAAPRSGSTSYVGSYFGVSKSSTKNRLVYMSSKAAAATAGPLYYEQTTGRIVTADGLFLGENQEDSDAASAKDPLVYLYSSVTALSQNRNYITGNFNALTPPIAGTYRLSITSTNSWIWFCGTSDYGSALGVEFKQLNCPTYYVNAELL